MCFIWTIAEYTRADRKCNTDILTHRSINATGKNRKEIILGNILEENYWNGCQLRNGRRSRPIK